MYSALEQYIHLNWENYRLAGTYRTSGNQKEKYAPKSNYNPSIFDRYIGATRLESKYVIENIEKNTLKKLEDNYNSKREDNYEALKRVNDDIKQAIFVKVVENANLGKDIDVNAVARHLVFDDAINNIKLNLSAFSTPELRLKYPKLAGEAYTNWNTVEAAFNVAKNRIDAIENKTHKKYLNDMLKEKRQEVNKAMQLHNIEVETARKAGAQLNPKLASGRKNAFSREVGDEILKWIRELTSVADGVFKLAKLQASFAEIMGVLIKDDIATATKAAIVEKLAEIPGATLTSSHLKADSLDIYFPQDFYSSYIEQDKKKAEQFKTLMQVQAPDGSWLWTFKTDHKTKQKMDFILEFEGKEIGINLKTYDMNQEFRVQNGAKVPATIALHSGTDFNKIRKVLDAQGAQFGSHLVNVLSNKEADSSILEKAKQSLQITLLYQAITGAGFGKNDKLAEIFVIEDKSKKLKSGINRVRFYNIYSIINSLFDDIYNNLNTGPIEIEPTSEELMNKLRNANTIVDPEADGPKQRGKAIQRRLFNIVEASRQEKMTIFIQKNYLNSIYLT